MFPLQPRIRALTLDVEVILRGRGGWVWGRVCMGSQGSLAQDSDEPILPLFPYLLQDLPVRQSSAQVYFPDKG